MHSIEKQRQVHTSFAAKVCGGYKAWTKGWHDRRARSITLDCTTRIDHDDFKISLSLMCTLLDLSRRVSLSHFPIHSTLLVIIIGEGSSAFYAPT